MQKNDEAGCGSCPEGRRVMEYLLGRAIGRLWRNRKVYIVLLAELTAGLVIIACQMNTALAVRQRMEKYREQFSESGVTINAYVDGKGGEDVGLPVEKRDFEYISAEYGNTFHISYIAYGSVFVNGMTRIPVLGMSETAMRNLLGTAGTDTACPFIGEDAKMLLGNGEIDKGDGDIIITAGEISLGGTAYDFRTFAGKEEKLISFSPLSSDDLDVVDCIVIPVSLQELLEENRIFYNAGIEMIPVEGTDESVTAKAVNEVTAYLTGQHEAYTYEAADRIEEYRNNSRDLSSTMELLSWVAKFSVLLTAAGMIGILMIFLDRREKDIRISLWIGAAKWKLQTELFLEVLLLCLLAGGISLILACLAAPGLSTSQYTVKMSLQAAVGILAVCLVIAGGTCMAVFLCAGAKGKKGF